MLYVNTGITNDAYSRRRSCRLMCARLNHTVHSLRNATLASCLHLATSSASPSKDPIRSTCRLILVRSVFEPLMVSDHSARHGGAMRLMSSIFTVTKHEFYFTVTKHEFYFTVIKHEFYFTVTKHEFYFTVIKHEFKCLEYWLWFNLALTDDLNYSNCVGNAYKHYLYTATLH